MGGNIAWTVRFSTGQEYRTQRWTNVTPWIGRNLDFYAEDPSAVVEVMGSWLDMKRDWEKNKDTGLYEHNMTSVYAPYPFGLRPSEYGIIVHDFKNKSIVDCNSYTDYAGPIFFHELWLQDVDEDDDDNDTLKQVKAIHGAGLMRGWYDHFRDEEHLMPGASLEDIVKAGAEVDKKRDGGKYGFCHLSWNLPEGWSRRSYASDTKEGRRAAVAHIGSLGFIPEKDDMKELTDWAEFRGDYEW
jgi:hypothetical protein